jgi:ADP-heptose:LPS heptosyltransferase
LQKVQILKKILIIQTASLGDVVLATPLIEKLFDKYPNAKINFLLKYGYEGVFRRHPKLHHVIVWDKTEKKYKKLFELIKLIREHKYDAVINLQRFTSSGLITAFSGSPIRIGFNKNPLSIFYTKRIKHKIGKGLDNPHETLRNLKLIESITDGGSAPMRLYPRQKHNAKVSQYKTVSYICIAPASLWFTKQYPEDKWVDFASKVDKDLRIYFLGSPKEKDLCKRIIDASGNSNSLNLAGELTFLESAALMKDAVMNYVNDSAPMHFASAMNANTTVIYCSTVPEFGFGPLSENSTIIETKKQLNCKPCGLHGFKSCPKKHFDCATSIETNQLLEVL